MKRRVKRTTHCMRVEAGLIKRARKYNLKVSEVIEQALKAAIYFEETKELENLTSGGSKHRELGH